MEEFILGKGAARQEAEEVRVEGGDAVRELKRSMLEGTKVQSYFLKCTKKTFCSYCMPINRNQLREDLINEKDFRSVAYCNCECQIKHFGKLNRMDIKSNVRNIESF